MKGNIDAGMVVDVVVATYNAGDFLYEQLESILNQTYKNIRVLIRDDGSTDGTIDNIKDFTLRDNRVIFIQDALPAKGVGENFKQLLKHCSAEYVLLADQDDVWYLDKIEKLLAYATEHFDNSKPCIAYAPGVVTDDNLKSLGKLTDTQLKIRSIEDIFLMNGGVQGCAMIINKSLYSMAIKSDFFWYMHDQVLSLYAICFGCISFMENPLFLYRQHGRNVIGFNSSTVALKLKKYISPSSSTFLIKKSSNDLFADFLSFELNNLTNDKKIIFKKYFKSKNTKLSFLVFIVKYRIKLHHSVLDAMVKLFLTNEVVEH